MIHLYLIRHGQSETNAQPDQLGQSPYVNLSKYGIEQCHELKDRFDQENINFDQVYSSNYNRALLTAQIVCGSYLNYSSIKITDALREYSAGDWTGQSRSKTLTPEVKLNMANLANSFLPPNGESMNMVQRRVSQWLDDHIIYNEEYNSLPIVRVGVFTHGMVIKCLLRYIMGFDQSFVWRIELENTSITRLTFGKEGWKLVTVNDCNHLL